jgi:hypothetical protein
MSTLAFACLVVNARCDLSDLSLLYQVVVSGLTAVRKKRPERGSTL